MVATDIDGFLKPLGMTRYQVAKIAGIGESTLNEARKRPVNRMTVKTLQALAMATGKTPGVVLDELLKLQGNPIINFIQAHPFVDKQLASEVEDLMITAHEHDLKLANITFNRYYDEGPDNNERAEKALQNIKAQLMDIIEDYS
ncbi:XRE family transcriptional regulator (plasmid) [Latilactobacillus curvatus]|uniref:XRE family transcriptional regulator n=1 Tax=Latilactobacillus curvatus TaxID=28038 RepID=A0A385AGR5_LATCU|nr:helix-turn-helix domain-containing protein [Latilactobacillus curvatus]AXN36885.1 XRE family transcriptional regulator [Latilactobacillus curvatus]